MNNDLEKFRGGPNRPAQFRMRVTLTHANVLSFNRNTYQRLGSPPAAFLYYGRTRGMIVVEPVRNPDLPEAFPILTKGPCGYRINIAPFCRHFGISVERTQRFIDPEIRDGRLELRLTNTVTVAQVRRPKKRPSS